MGSESRQLDYDCGISHDRIASWLTDELELPFDNGRWAFGGGGQLCYISLDRSENRVLGTVSLDRSHFRVQGNPDAISSFEKLFTMRFVSAGG